MELSNRDHDATISLEDLQAIAEIGLLRMPIKEVESKRAALVRTIVAAESELAHILASHTRCMLVNGQGTPGIGNLAHETERLHAALARYAELVRDVSSDRRRLAEIASGRSRTEGIEMSRDRAAGSSSPNAPLRRAG